MYTLDMRIRHISIRFGYVVACCTAFSILTSCQSRTSSNSVRQEAESPRPKLSLKIDLSKQGVPQLPGAKENSGVSENGVSFTEVQQQLGLSHSYINGETGRCLIVETIGGGCGWLDYDNDGRWDLVVNQGGDPTTKIRIGQPSDKLFRCLDHHSFVDVSTRARFFEPNYSQAVAVGDYDNDGFDDFYVSNVFENTLWHNCGDGTFEEVANRAGVADGRWSSSAAWTDLDRDGDLDLYVCNYTVYDPTQPIPCKDTSGRDALCAPGVLEPSPDGCFINQGDGTFIDQAKTLGLIGPGNRALGVAATDFNNDGWPDLYIANDSTENFLFINQANGKFGNQASTLGCAVDREGNSQASMGVAVGDYDGNGFLDIFCTNYFEESNTLYANYGPRGFQDVTALTQLHQPTLAYLGFGTVMHDFDLDGRMELFIANGHVDNSPTNSNQKMKPQMFTLANKRWQDIGPAAGPYFQKKFLGRGVATCDLDNDGDLDLAIVNQNDPLVLLRNDSKTSNWLKFKFIGTISNRRGIGCRIIVRIGGTSYVQEVSGGTSYASTHEPTCVFAMGDHVNPDSVQVTWPSGIKQELTNIAANQTLEIVEPTK